MMTLNMVVRLMCVRSKIERGKDAREKKRERREGRKEGGRGGGREGRREEGSWSPAKVVFVSGFEDSKPSTRID